MTLLSCIFTVCSSELANTSRQSIIFGRAAGRVRNCSLVFETQTVTCRLTARAHACDSRPSPPERCHMGELFSRVTVVQRRGEEPESVTVYKDPGSRRRKSPHTLTELLERMARQLIRAQMVFGQEVLRRHEGEPPQAGRMADRGTVHARRARAVKPITKRAREFVQDSAEGLARPRSLQTCRQRRNVKEDAEKLAGRSSWS